MGFFSFLSGKKKSNDPYLSQDKTSVTESFKLQGPRYLRNHLKRPDLELLQHVKIRKPDIEWVGQLVSTKNNLYFEINYYGNLLGKETVVSTLEAVQKVITIDTESKEEIILFDMALHGFDGFIAKAYENDLSIIRDTNNKYISKKNSNKFQILIRAYYNQGTKEEIAAYENEQDQIQKDFPSYSSMQDIFDDAFDCLSIYAIDEQGNKFTIIEEELA